MIFAQDLRVVVRHEHVFAAYDGTDGGARGQRHLVHVLAHDARRLAVAVRHGLGSASQPVVNTAILGAFARATGVVGLDEVLAAIEHGVPTRTEENRAAAVEAHEAVRMTVPA